MNKYEVDILNSFKKIAPAYTRIQANFEPVGDPAKQTYSVRFTAPYPKLKPKEVHFDPGSGVYLLVFENGFTLVHCSSVILDVNDIKESPDEKITP